ncbi:MAG: hypothetical protein ABIW79_07205 [Gemmatimonas sp.]
MRWLERSAWAVLLLLVALLSVEVTVRLDDWAQHGVPLTEGANSLDDLMVRDSLGVHARASTRFRQFRINSLGFRGAEVSARALDTAKVIVVSGASETFGLYESDGKEWPRQLEDSLAMRCASRPVVLNAAFAGMSLPTVEQDVRVRIASLRPDLVVYYPTPMQYLEGERPTPAERSTTPPVLASQSRLRSPPRFRDAAKRIAPEALLDAMRVWFTRRMRAETGIAVRQEAPAAMRDAFEHDLRRLVGAIRGTGAQAALVVHQNRFRDRTTIEEQRLLRAWERFYPLYSADAILSFDEYAAKRTAAVAADSGVILVDPTLLLRAEPTPPFADFSHYTDRGSGIVAGAVARGLTSVLCAAGTVQVPAPGDGTTGQSESERHGLPARE